LAAFDGTTLPEGLRASISGWIQEANQKRAWIGGAALQEVVAVNVLSPPLTASRLSAPSCSAVENVTENAAVDDSAHMPTRYSTTTPADSLCASMSGMVLEVATEPSCEFEGDALQEAASMNGLSSDGQQGWQQSRTVTLLGLHSRESSQ